jgi:hypothetical protein
MRGKPQVEHGSVPAEAEFEVIVDPSLDQQVVGGGLLVFWWTKDDGRREGMLCEIQLCPVPMCPCREAELHAVRVDPELRRVWMDKERRYHVEGKDGPIDLDKEECQAAILVTFERHDRRLGPAAGDRELVRRLHEAFDGEMVRFVEAYWEERQRTDPAARLAVEPGRNGPCPCGSGKKYKRCCLARGIRIQRLPGGVDSVTKYFPNHDDGSGPGLH